MTWSTLLRVLSVEEIQYGAILKIVRSVVRIYGEELWVQFQRFRGLLAPKQIG